MKYQDKIKPKKFSQSDLIQELIETFTDIYSKETVEIIISTFEEIIFSHLKEATANKPVLIKPFSGVQFTSRLIPETQCVSPFDDLTYTRSERLQAHARFTRYFNREKLNEV